MEHLGFAQKFADRRLEDCGVREQRNPQSMFFEVLAALPEERVQQGLAETVERHPLGTMRGDLADDMLEQVQRHNALRPRIYAHRAILASGVTVRANLNIDA